ncbi:MAG: 4'-phosphopantetheinyl transferase superfamily protein [Aquihabitans sp.]
MSARFPVIAPGVVAVWNVWIGATPDDRRARAILADDEFARASSFVYDLHRNRYAAGRLALRELLGRYLDLAPSDVRFVYSDHGKPEVPGVALRFNVAHSDDLAVIALTEQDRLGVDVERLRDLPDIEGVARSIFSERELDTFRALPDSSKTSGFFTCWTRKEAYVKAIGEGLSHPLDVFDATLRPGEEARLLEVEGSTERAGRWSLFDLSPMEGWVGAVAVESSEAEVKHAGWLGEPPVA